MFEFRFCQGETQHGLKFETFYGKEWENNVEKKFREWAVRVFGGASNDFPTCLQPDLTHYREGK
jgi:hypothetical protein